MVPNRPKSLPKRLTTNSLLSTPAAAEGGNPAHAAHLNGKAAHPVAEDADAVDHEVHRHGMPGILRPGEPALGHGKPCLHEHDQKAADQHPNHIDRDPVMPDNVRQLCGQRFTLPHGCQLLGGWRTSSSADHIRCSPG